MSTIVDLNEPILEEISQDDTLSITCLIDKYTSLLELLLCVITWAKSELLIKANKAAVAVESVGSS